MNIASCWALGERKMRGSPRLWKDLPSATVDRDRLFMDYDMVASLVLAPFPGPHGPPLYRGQNRKPFVSCSFGE